MFPPALACNVNCESEAAVMPYCDIFNKPYFIVPPDDPRVGLLFEQVNCLMSTGGFSYKAKDGRAFISPGIYFGTIVIYGNDAKVGAELEARNAVIEACGGGDDDVVRIDFAWLNGGAVVLRAGAPGGRPVPFSEFSKEALAFLCEYVSSFMERSYADVIMAREMVDAEEDVLFEGEDQFYEGFMGRDLMPLEVSVGMGGALVCDGLAIAPEGSLAYEAICAGLESCCDDAAYSSRNKAQGSKRI